MATLSMFTAVCDGPPLRPRDYPPITKEDMASIADFGIPGAGSGILHPLLAYRWRVMFPGCKHITMQAVRLKIDLLKSELTLWVEQPLAPAEEFLHEIAKIGARKGGSHGGNMTIDLMDGNDGVVGQFRGYAKMTEHDFTLDYGNTGVATHVMKFDFTPGAAHSQ